MKNPKTKKIQIFTSLIGLVGLFSLPLIGIADEHSSSYSGGATFETERDLKGYSILGSDVLSDKYRFKAKVKMYENGDAELEEIRYMIDTILVQYEPLGLDIETSLLGAYREVLHRDLGAEIGIHYIGTKVRKQMEFEQLDEMTFFIEGQVSLNALSNIKTSSRNEFIDSLESQTEESDRAHFRGGNNLDPRNWDYNAELRAGLNKETGEADFSIEGYAKRYGERKLKSYDGHQYGMAKNEAGIKFTYTPDRENCSRVSAGVRVMDFDQSYNSYSSDFSASEIYVQYECRYDVIKHFYGVGKKPELVRY